MRGCVTLGGGRTPVRTGGAEAGYRPWLPTGRHPLPPKREAGISEKNGVGPGAGTRLWAAGLSVGGTEGSTEAPLALGAG